MIVNTEIKIDKIKISHFFGDIKLVVHDEMHYDISSKKEKDDVQQFQCSATEDTLTIKGMDNFENAYPLIIRIPYNAISRLEIHGASELHMDNVSEKLSLVLNGQFDLSLKNINELDIQATGQLNGKINNTKELSLFVSGKSKMEIKSSRIDSLKCSLNGINDVFLKGDVHVFDLDMIGEGSFVSKGKIDIKSISNTDLCDISVKEH